MKLNPPKKLGMNFYFGRLRRERILVLILGLCPPLAKPFCENTRPVVNRFLKQFL
jgi:hypothetical protein